MRTWDFAYRSARRGHWEQMGRDRGRFLNRIKRTEEILSPCLEREHRNKIYLNRFLNELDVV